MNVCVYVCMCVYVCVYVCMYVCIYVRMCALYMCSAGLHYEDMFFFLDD